MTTTTTSVIGTVVQVLDTGARRTALVALGNRSDTTLTDTLIIDCTYAGADVQVGTKARVTVAWGETQLPPASADLDTLDALYEAATKGPWYLGAQNDYVYIVAGRAPSLNNDYPWHDAPRTLVAKTYTGRVGDGPDSHLIVALHNAYPALRDKIKALEDRVRMLEATAEEWTSSYSSPSER